MTRFRHSRRRDVQGGERELSGRTAPRRLLPVVAVLVVAGLAAGLALASRSARPIGKGVVVIDTNLAYQDAAAAGTGIVLTPSGEMLTNNHVVKGATTIKVVVPGAGRSYSAKVVGYDVAADVAVLQDAGASNLKTVALGDSSKLAVGQPVSFLGNAGGTGSLTSGRGSITGLGRSITANDEQGSEQLSGLIGTNVGLQPGDSGGPLLNSVGLVVGMDAAGSSQGFGLETSSADSYAIPINTALTLAKQIEAGIPSAAVHVGGTAFLGIEVKSAGATPESSGVGFGIGPSASSGGVIAGVVAGGPAAGTGLAVGDVITAFDGRPISTPDQITTALLAKAPGAKISVTYQDQSRASHIATVTLGSGPPQ
jgi:S1-C subfamily serine protease